MAVESRSLGFDAETGIEEIYHYDHATDDITIERKQIVDDVVESNKRLFNDAESGFKRDWHLVARIPLSILAELDAKGITRDTKAFKKWLNDRDNRVFRTKAAYL